MLATISIALPFHIAIPEGETFKVYEFEDNGFHICEFPPRRTNQPLPTETLKTLSMNGVPAILTNSLYLEVQKDSFQRERNGKLDPPIDVIERALQSFLVRLRYVTRAVHIPPLTLIDTTWRIRYLNDDGSELPETTEQYRGYRSRRMTFSTIGVTPQVWDKVFGLPASFTPPVWDTLYLDAEAALPNVGTAVVLAATSLEVFIAQQLNHLVSQSEVPTPFWDWANNRGNHLKEPSVEEQFDILLSLLTGHSLKEESTLWTAFKHLRTARNTFVHGGVPRIGKDDLSISAAGKLVKQSREIVNWVKQWLPNSLHWPEFESSTTYEFDLDLPFKVSPEDPREPDNEDFDNTDAPNAPE